MLRSSSKVWRALTVLALALGAVACSGCDEDALKPSQVDGGAPAGGLTPEQASQVVARVGDKVITLGDFAAALERMNQFDRLRYQTKERRRELLDEMIDVELLAQEARRRGLDKRPEVQEAIRQILRDALLAQARDGVPPPGAIPQSEVQRYYDENEDKFREPERRRVSVIVLDDEQKAAAALAAARAIKSGNEWGDLYFQSSIDAPAERSPHAPVDLAGDRGIVGPPGDAKGANQSVPEPVRAAVFTLGAVGDVYSEVVADGDRYYVVRMSGLSKGHVRTVAEADRSIRVAILQRMIDDRERDLEEQLRKRFDVQIDDAALKRVSPPNGGEDKPLWDKPPAPEPSAQPSAEPPDEEGDEP